MALKHSRSHLAPIFCARAQSAGNFEILIEELMPREYEYSDLFIACPKKKHPREEEKQDWYCSIVVYRIVILLRELKRRISIEASLFRALKQTRVHNIANIYCEHNIASSGLCHNRTIPNRDMRSRTERRIFHYGRPPPPLFN